MLYRRLVVMELIGLNDEWPCCRHCHCLCLWFCLLLVEIGLYDEGRNGRQPLRAAAECGKV